MKTIVTKVLMVLFMNGIIQVNFSQSFSSWNRLNLQLNLNEKFVIKQEIDERFKTLPEIQQSQFALRTVIGFKTKRNVQYGVGTSNFWHYNTTSTIPIINYELRPMLEFIKKIKPFEKSNFEIRLWTEFRFFKSHILDYKNNRSRLKIDWNYNLTKSLKFKCYEEIMINLLSARSINLFDQNRFGIALEKEINGYFRIEVGYINLFQQTVFTNTFASNHILRISIGLKL